jgi:hypothetical protein
VKEYVYEHPQRPKEESMFAKESRGLTVLPVLVARENICTYLNLQTTIRIRVRLFMRNEYMERRNWLNSGLYYDYFMVVLL